MTLYIVLGHSSGTLPLLRSLKNFAFNINWWFSVWKLEANYLQKSFTYNSSDEFLFWMNGGAKLTNERPVSVSLNLRKDNIIADKNRWFFLRIFLGFCRSLLIKAKRLSYRLYNPIVWEPQKFTFIQNKNSSLLISLFCVNIL